MQSIIKTQILVIISIISLIFLAHMGYVKATVEQLNEQYILLQEPVTPPTGETKLIPVNFYLLSDDELSPQLPKEGKPDSVATCPNGFVPARWSIFGRFGSVNWKDVGTWFTIPVNKPLKAAGVVNFRIWVSYTGSGSPSGTFDFYWKRNEENIAEAKSVSISFSNSMPPTLVDIQAPLINQTPFQPGDIFSVYIRCRCNFDGAQILFGSRAHASALVMNCDPISIINVDAHKDHVKGIYDDIFSVKPGDMMFEAKVDNVYIKSLPKIDSEMYQGKHYRAVIWETKIEKGVHDVEVRLTYGGLDNTTVISLMKQIKIKGPVEPTWFGIPLWIWQLIFGIIILVAVIGGALSYKSYREEKRWQREQGYIK